jgi:hypothetical protein
MSLHDIAEVIEREMCAQENRRYIPWGGLYLGRKPIARKYNKMWVSRQIQAVNQIEASLEIAKGSDREDLRKRLPG